MDIFSIVVGATLVIVGVMGLCYPERWGRRYQGLIDGMPKFYRDANVWEGTERELSTRLSVCWIVVGAVFIVWPVWYFFGN